MKITILTHHYPPNYYAGAEQYAFRMSKHLQQRGHDVEVVTIESINEGDLEPRVEKGFHQNIPVWRLCFDIARAPNQFEWLFRNPQLGEWYRRHLQESKPDIVHINGGYLVGGKAFEAAFELKIPIVLTLHEYWFMCPLGTLLRPTGEICDSPVPPERCTWCMLSEKRRYRIPDTWTSGLLGDLFSLAYQVPLYRKITSTAEITRQVEERRAYLKMILERVDAIISPSRFLISKLYEYGFKPRQIHYLPFSIDLQPIDPTSEDDRAQPLKIGYLGQLASHKGVHLLIEAFLRLKNAERAELFIYGKPAEKSKYYSHIRRLAGTDPRIHFMGGYVNSKVNQVLADLDAIVTPSIWYENRPTVIVEAQAACKAVIAPRLGGMEELVEHEVNGLVYEPGSLAELKSQLQRLVDEPGLARRLGDGAPQVVTVNQEMDKLVDVYQAVMSESSPVV